MNRIIVASAMLVGVVDAGCCPTPTGTCCYEPCDCRYGESSPSTLKELFEEFKVTHSRSYSTQEEEMRRFKIFGDTLKLIDVRNRADKAAGGSAVHGITRFADLTQEEFASMYLDSRTSRYIRERNATVVSTPKGLTSGAVDYTGKQTTAIKDQGNCGSCW